MGGKGAGHKSVRALLSRQALEAVASGWWLVASGEERTADSSHGDIFMWAACRG